MAEPALSVPRSVRVPHTLDPPGPAGPGGWTDPGDASLHLPISPHVTARARHAATGLAAPADAEALWRIELLVSELVGNILRHAPGASELVVRLWRRPARLRVAVCDNGPGGTVGARRPTPFDTDGRGLALVGRLVRRWGTEALEPGTCVWFELDLGEGPSALPREGP